MPWPAAPPRFRPAGPAPLGCCETPAVSLAEAQQELQMLQKQLGESEHVLPGLCACERQPACVALHGFGWMTVLYETT